MIKRIRLTARADTARSAATAALDAPPDVRPVRAACCTALPRVLPDPAFGGIALEWFTDEGHLRRFRSWADGAHGHEVNGDEANGHGAGGIVIAREHPMRGADWLERRWREGGTRLKHMAVARRAAHLTSAEFSERWRGRAGRVGAVPIPEAARGRAYVQNHPLLTDGCDWPYDAVNEVYFDDLDGLRTRIAWFAEHAGATGEDDLVGENRFVAVEEEPL